jgi:hypothetical protein
LRVFDGRIGAQGACGGEDAGAAGQADGAPVRFARELDDQLAWREAVRGADPAGRAGTPRGRAEQHHEGSQSRSQS